jgi:hypothetical protein
LAIAIRAASFGAGGDGATAAFDTTNTLATIGILARTVAFAAFGALGFWGGANAANTGNSLTAGGDITILGVITGKGAGNLIGGDIRDDILADAVGAGERGAVVFLAIVNVIARTADIRAERDRIEVEGFACIYTASFKAGHQVPAGLASGVILAGVTGFWADTINDLLAAPIGVFRPLQTGIIAITSTRILCTREYDSHHQQTTQRQEAHPKDTFPAHEYNSFKMRNLFPLSNRKHQVFSWMIDGLLDGDFAQEKHLAHQSC